METDLWAGYVEGWDDILPTPWSPGLTGQQPWETNVRVVFPGRSLDSKDSFPLERDDPPRVTEAHGVPELVHKSWLQLPEREQYGQPDALLLTPESMYVYKVFCAGGSFGAMITRWLRAPADGRIAFQVPCRVHVNPHPGGDDSPGAAVWRLRVDHLPVEDWRTFGNGFGDREWVWSTWTMDATAGQRISVTLQCESRAEAGIDFFTDLNAWEAMFTPDEELVAEPETVGYVVVANLLPQDATAEEYEHVLAETHGERQSIVYSADDAARLVAPGQDGSYVRVWEPERWDGIIAFLEAHGVVDIREAQFPGPDPEPEPTWIPARYITAGTVLGWHAVGNCGLPELYAPELVAPSIKLVQAVGDIGKMPARYRVLRFIDAPRLGNLEGFNYAGNPEAQAEARMAALLPLLGPHAGAFDFAEIINEQAPPHPEDGVLLGHFFNRAMELCPSWMRLLLFSLSTGEPADPAPTWAAVASTGVLEKAAAGGHGIALHAYYDHRVPGDVEWHLLRFRLLYDAHILPKRLNIPLFLTELGPWEHLMEQAGFPLEEWIRATDGHLRQYPYLAGGHLFTVSDVSGWESFNKRFKAMYPWFGSWARSIKDRDNNGQV